MKNKDDGALSRGNMPVQAKANGLQLCTIIILILHFSVCECACVYTSGRSPEAI